MALDRPKAARWERAALAGLLFVATVLMGRPILRSPLTLALGSSKSEAPRHFWGLWATAAHLTEWGPFVAHLDVNYPIGYTRHLMDPVNLLFFLPGYWLGGGGTRGATLGYNLVHLGWPVVGGVGGWLLARRLLLATGIARDLAPASLLAAFACATAPYLLATPSLGRSELLPGVAWPLHLWLLHRAVSEDGHSWDAVGAGAVLAAIALGGWYLAAWMALLEPPVALWFAARSGRPWRSSAGRLAMVAVVGVVPTLPALWALLAYPPPILHEEQRVSAHMGICTPPQLLLPFASNQGLPGTDLPAYPGTVVALLALWGAVRFRAARGWVLLGLAILVVSLGPFLVWTNDARALVANPPRLPAWWIEKFIPPLRFIWGWCRLGILVTAPLATAAAWGVVDLARRVRGIRPQAFGLLLVVIALDHARSRMPAGIEGSAFDPAPPQELVALLPKLPRGALLDLPFDDAYMTWQLAIGRPMAESLEVEDVRRNSYLVQKAMALIVAWRDRTDPLPEVPADGSSNQGVERLDLDQVKAAIFQPEVQRCASADAEKLGKAGYAAILLHRDRLPDAHLDLTKWLTAALGQPVWDSFDLAVWLARGTPAPDLDCAVKKIGPIEPGKSDMDRLTANP